MGTQQSNLYLAAIMIYMYIICIQILNRYQYTYNTYLIKSVVY